MKENFLEKNRFYYLEGKQKISYYLLHCFLLNMNENNKKESKFNWNDNFEPITIKIIENEKDYFKFKINNGSSLYIEGSKKIFFYYKDGEIKNEILVYNSAQITEYQISVIDEYNDENICFYDSSDKLITDEKNIFNKVHHLKIYQKNILLEQKKKESYYQSLFEKYLGNNFQNEGEKLSFNLFEYSGQEPDAFEYISSDERKKLIDYLDDYIKECDDNNLAITGLSGTGKTVTLLEFLKNKNLNYPNCYFNLKYLYRISTTEKLALEFVKLFNRKKLYDYYKKLVDIIEEKNDLPFLDKIITILDYIIDIGRIKEKIIIVIDQYKIGLDLDSKFINRILSDKYKSKIKFIICSSINEKDVKSNLTYSYIFKKLMLKNLLIYKCIDILISVKDIIKNKQIKNIMKQFNYLPKYYFLFTKNYHKDIEVVEDEQNLKNQIKKFLQDEFNELKDKLVSFFNKNNIDIIKEYNIICRILQGEIIKEEFFSNYMNKIPLKYCKYSVENNMIHISAAFNFFYGPLREIYKTKSNDNLINTGLISKNRAELGNIFDCLVNHHFDVDKIIFGLHIAHVIIVNEIINFSYFKQIIHEDKDYFQDKLNIKKLFDGKIIYIEQNNSNGRYVDGGFLIPDATPNYYSILLYQSSIRKRKHFTKEFIYNYIYKTCKNNFFQMFGIVITKIYFMYILDYGDKTTINYCHEAGIYYIFYDFVKSSFFYSNSNEIKNFSKNIFASLEIQRPDPKLIELFNTYDKNKDITTIKRFYLSKKRNKKEEDDKINKTKKLKKQIKIIETDKGYKNEKANLKKISKNPFQKKASKNINSPEDEEKYKMLVIKDEWTNIFKGYNSYQLLQEKLYVYNAIFELPIFYILDNKYIIVKNNDKDKSVYSIYYENTGEKVEEPELNEILNSINIFSNSDKKILYLDAYCLESTNND